MGQIIGPMLCKLNTDTRIVIEGRETVSALPTADTVLVGTQKLYSGAAANVSLKAKKKPLLNASIYGKRRREVDANKFHIWGILCGLLSSAPTFFVLIGPFFLSPIDWFSLLILLPYALLSIYALYRFWTRKPNTLSKVVLFGMNLLVGFSISGGLDSPYLIIIILLFISLITFVFVIDSSE